MCARSEPNITRLTNDAPGVAVHSRPSWDDCVHARAFVTVEATAVVVTVHASGPNDMLKCIHESLNHVLHGPTLRYKLAARVDEVSARGCPSPNTRDHRDE